MKTAIITGASSGLGKEFARQVRDVFPEIQCLWLIARRADRLQALSAALPGVVVKPISLDLTAADACGQLTALLEAEQPEVSLLINCAGCGIWGNFDESNLEEQLRMIDLNIRALTAVTRAVLPHIPSGGRIINISSIASFVPNARMSVYSASKAYVSFFSRGLYEELKPRKIAVTAVCPGPMETEFLSVGRITGNSKTFDRLPYCNPKKVVHGSLVASKKGQAVHTPRGFYKFYRVLSGLVPHAILVHAAKT